MNEEVLNIPSDKEFALASDIILDRLNCGNDDLWGEYIDWSPGVDRDILKKTYAVEGISDMSDFKRHYWLTKVKYPGIPIEDIKIIEGL